MGTELVAKETAAACAGSICRFVAGGDVRGEPEARGSWRKVAPRESCGSTPNPVEECCEEDEDMVVPESLGIGSIVAESEDFD